MNKEAFYFTFGSNEQFPYPNSYLVVVAQSERVARAIFQDKYPNRPGSNLLNCSFIYTQKEWDESVSKYYPDGPSDIISQDGPDNLLDHLKYGANGDYSSDPFAGSPYENQPLDLKSDEPSRGL